MDTLRTRLIAVERTARKSVQPAKAGADEAGRPRTRARISGVLVAVLVVTNIVTWRALVNERAIHTAAAQQKEPPLRQGPSAWPGSPNWGTVRQFASNGIPGRGAASVQMVSPAVKTNLKSMQALARKLGDPEAHDALRNQQKGSTLQLYGELIKRWHL